MNSIRPGVPPAEGIMGGLRALEVWNWTLCGTEAAATIAWSGEPFLSIYYKKCPDMLYSPMAWAASELDTFGVSLHELRDETEQVDEGRATHLSKVVLSAARRMQSIWVVFPYGEKKVLASKFVAPSGAVFYGRREIATIKEAVAPPRNYGVSRLLEIALILAFEYPPKVLDSGLRDPGAFPPLADFRAFMLNSC